MRYAGYIVLALLLFSCQKEPKEYTVRYSVSVPVESRVIIDFLDHGMHKTRDEKVTTWTLETTALPGDTAYIRARNMNLQNSDWVRVTLQSADGQPDILTSIDSGFDCSTSQAVIIR